MNTLVLLLLVLVVLSFLRTAWAPRRGAARSIRDKVPSWLTAPSDGEPNVGDARNERHRRRRRARRATELGPEEDMVTPETPHANTADGTPEGNGRAVSRRPTRAELRAAIVWSEILAPPRGLAAGQELERLS
jgi:hypothetical protein